MDPATIFLGVVLIGLGVFSIGFPNYLRSFVSAQTWRDDPERAERYQRLWAYGVGITIVVLGFVVVGLGIVAS
ncbi:hypothetical protein [Halosimplex amylolyticum]|uniref:hypothetical protein n=1 Tax=Halosimplex amylolyticum TaxID=3396616 RepID=UPI003F552E23